MANSTFSRLIAGTMYWGEWGKNLSEKEMDERISACVSVGITSFDHADIYGGYTTEAAFGKALKRKGQRAAIQLITKCGIQYPCANRPLPVKYYDYSSAHILNSVEQSLKNLRTDYLDMLLLHRPSPLMQPEEIALATDQLLRSGKIKGFGLSNFTSEQTSLIKKYCAVQVNQIQCSLTHSEALTNGALHYMMEHHITPMAWSPFGEVYKQENAQTSRIQQMLHQLAERYNTPADIIPLAWLLHHPGKIHPVFGTTEVARIKNLPLALDLAWETADWFSLWVAARGEKVP